jgi:hypothetical protein
LTDWLKIGNNTSGEYMHGKLNRSGTNAGIKIIAGIVCHWDIDLFIADWGLFISCLEPAYARSADVSTWVDRLEGRKEEIRIVVDSGRYCNFSFICSVIFTAITRACKGSVFLWTRTSIDNIFPL